MVLKEIAMLKTFLDVLGYDGLFISFFRDYRIKTNPISLEQFLTEADYKNVLVSAFYFIPNADYGYDFWTKLQNRFSRYVEGKDEEYSDDDVVAMRKKCESLRENWDKATHWKKESRLIASKRNGIYLPLEKMKLILMSREDQGIATKEEREIVAERERELSRVVDSLQEDSVQEDVVHEQVADDFLADFETFEVKKKSTHRQLDDDEITINTKGKSGRITFNQKVTADILARGSYEFCKLGRTKNGDVTLLFNDEDGVNVIDGSNQKDKDKTINVSISNKSMCGKIYNLLNIAESVEFIKLRIKLIAKTADYEAYALSKIEE